MTELSAVAVDRVRLRLLGDWHLLVDGVEVGLGHREQRLVALLCLTGCSSRAQVAAALWPDSTDERALASLRRAVLLCVRRCPGLLDARRATIALDRTVQADVDDVRRAAGLTQLPLSGEVARELLAALGGDELLPGWYDDWVIAEREQLQQLRVEALDRISRHALDAGDLELAIEAAGATTGIDPLLESAREVSIRAHLGRGDLSSAVHEFHRYRALMEEELGVAPSSEILGLLAPVFALPPSPAPLEPATHPEVLPVESLFLEEHPDPFDDPFADPFADDETDDETDEPPTGRRRSHLMLAGAAGLALAAALAIAMSGPDRGGDPTTDPGAGASVARPGGPPTGAGPDPATEPVREVAVRALDSEDGSAAFTVRATMRPAPVTLILRGRAGLRVVRHLVVRGAAGSEVVLDGLDPGTYRWSARSASAKVDGVVSVDTPSQESVDEEPAVVATTAPSVTPVVETSTPTPRPPRPRPPRRPRLRLRRRRRPRRRASTPSPTPSQSSHPTETPSDPATVAPTPVG